MRAARLFTLLLALAGASAITLGLVWAADKYPSRPIHWVVGFAAGGPNDTTARIFGEWLGNHLGQQFVIEDRTGQGGMIAANYVLKSAPDGYTVMFVAPNNAIGTTLYKHLPFDFLKDAAPVAGLMRLTNVMVVPPSLLGVLDSHGNPDQLFGDAHLLPLVGGDHGMGIVNIPDAVLCASVLVAASSNNVAKAAYAAAFGGAGARRPSALLLLLALLGVGAAAIYLVGL